MNQAADTLVAIFAPMRALLRLWEIVRVYLNGLQAIIASEHFTEQFHTDPQARCALEAHIAMAEDGIAILISQRTRELLGLGLKVTSLWRPQHPAKPRSMPELMKRYQRMLASLARIERSAQRRAARIRREMANNPTAACPLRLAASLRPTSPSLRLVEARHRCVASTSASHWGRWHACSRTHDGGGSHARGPPPQLFPKLKSPPCRLRLRERPRLKIHKDFAYRS